MRTETQLSHPDWITVTDITDGQPVHFRKNSVDGFGSTPTGRHFLMVRGATDMVPILESPEQVKRLLDWYPTPVRER